MNTALLRAGLDRCADPEVEWDQTSWQRCFAAQIIQAAGGTVSRDSTGWATALLHGEELHVSKAAEKLIDATSTAWMRTPGVGYIFSAAQSLVSLIEGVNILDPKGAERLATAAPQYDHDRPEHQLLEPVAA
jgi:hypothetical protein